MATATIFSEEQIASIKNAIAEAETKTSGELRVFIDDHCKQDVMEKALYVFRKLQMHETELQNGVLIYLSVKDKKFAIIGDKGIHEKVHDDFWNSTRNKMQERFIHGEFTEGLIDGIAEAGRVLSFHFPFQKNDADELSNDVIFGKE